MHRVLVEERRWLDERALPVGAELLHAAAGPRGDAARDLFRLAAARRQGRPRGRAAVRRCRARCSCWRCRSSTAPTARRRSVAALFTGVKAAVLAIVLEALLRVGRPRAQGPARLARRCRRLRRHLLLQRAVSRWSSSPPRSPAISARRRSAGRCRCRPPRPCRWRRRCARLRVWLAVWIVPLLAVAAALRHRPRAGAARLVLLQARRRHLRRRLRRARLHGAGGGRALRLADARRDARRPRPRRDDATARSSSSPSSSATRPRIASAAARPSCMGILGALVTLWATFAPCFLWIFAGAPYIERLTAAPRLASALCAPSPRPSSASSPTCRSGSRCTCLSRASTSASSGRCACRAGPRLASICVVAGAVACSRSCCCSSCTAASSTTLAVCAARVAAVAAAWRLPRASPCGGNR